MALNLNQTLQNKYPNLDIHISNFKSIDKEYLIFGSDFNGKSRELSLNSINSDKKVIDFFDLISKTFKNTNEKSFVYDLTHSLGNFLQDTELSNDLGSGKKLAIENDFVISRLRSYLQEMAVVQPKKHKQFFSTEYLIYRPKTDKISANTLLVFSLSKPVQNILNKSQYGTEHPRFYEFVFNEMPIPNSIFALNNEINNIMQMAYKCLEQSKDLYRQAEVLLYEELGLDPENPLASIETHLGSLKIDMHHSDLYRHSERSEESLSPNENQDSSPTAQNDEVVTAHNDKNLAMATKYAHLNISVRPLSQSLNATGRLDSEYYQGKYDEIERVIKNYRGGYFQISQSEIKDKNFNPQVNKQYRYIELANIGANGNISEPIVDFGENLPSRARRIVKTGDMIMSSVEGSLQSCALITDEFDNCIVSTGFYVLKSSNLNSETLLVLFKNAFFQEYLHKFPSGTILTAISKDELQNILIPKIAEQIQTQIADLLKQSFALRKTANELLQTAKSKVETAIEKDKPILQAA